MLNEVRVVNERAVRLSSPALHQSMLPLVEARCMLTGSPGRTM